MKKKNAFTTKTKGVRIWSHESSVSSRFGQLKTSWFDRNSNEWVSETQTPFVFALHHTNETSIAVGTFSYNSLEQHRSCIGLIRIWFPPWIGTLISSSPESEYWERYDLSYVTSAFLPRSLAIFLIVLPHTLPVTCSCLLIKCSCLHVHGYVIKGHA